jgi:hypothetical protein
MQTYFVISVYISETYGQISEKVVSLPIANICTYFPGREIVTDVVYWTV